MTSFEAEWETLLAAAQDEGEVSVFICCHIGNTIRPVLDKFEDMYGIRVLNSSGSSSQYATRVLAEREARSYQLDAWIGGDSTANTVLLPAGALTPLEPLLIRPDVTDPSVWYGNNMQWIDFPDEENILTFAGNGTLGEMAFNTDLVDESELTSYWDLLDPKWHGKIVIRDPRFAGTSIGTTFLYLNPDLGEEFMHRLLTETDIAVSNDERQIVEWVALGSYSICLICVGGELALAQEQGLPVSGLTSPLAEGAPLNHGGGAIWAMADAPHPNAMQFFVNWWLSPEGQSMVQEASGFNSLRTDIPKDDVDPINERIESIPYYFFVTLPDFQDQLAAAQAHATAALASVGK